MSWRHPSPSERRKAYLLAGILCLVGAIAGLVLEIRVGGHWYYSLLMVVVSAIFFWRYRQECKND
jgi:predicted membrane metal-binding protein